MGYRYDTTIMDVHKCMAVISHTPIFYVADCSAHNNENVFVAVIREKE